MGYFLPPRFPVSMEVHGRDERDANWRGHLRAYRLHNFIEFGLERGPSGRYYIRICFWFLGRYRNVTELCFNPDHQDFVRDPCLALSPDDDLLTPGQDRRNDGALPARQAGGHCVL